jgi:phosphatidylserine/phosphatidylglycerophosphate/cardiolipin synthase-like enzyme
MIRSVARRIHDWASTTRRRLLVIALAFVSICAMVGWYHMVKPLPSKLSFCGDPIPVSGSRLRLLTDLSFRGTDDAAVCEQQIFDEVLTMIGRARRLIVLDFFLFNDHPGLDERVHRPICSEMVAALVDARTRAPAMPIVFITDPINDIYGGDPSPQLRELESAGVQVVRTDLSRLRDSNPLYSGPWRVVARWWGNTSRGGWLPNPLDPTGPRVTLRTYLRMANFKANHRKVIVADDDETWVSLITSANPHDASSAHSNVALRIENGDFAGQVYRAEMEVVRMSRRPPPFDDLPALAAGEMRGDHEAAYLTESAIRDRVLQLIDSCGPGDEIDLALFYLSHRGVLGALRAAAGRGVWIRAVLDPNRDAFGHSKPGIPNRQTAEHLRRTSSGGIAVRWYATHGEQFHSKLIVIRRQRTVDAVLGSANFTRRNLDDYNLEASIWVRAPRGSALDRQLRLYIDRIWTNDDGLFTAPYERFRDTSKLRRFSAWLQEVTGLGTF